MAAYPKRDVESTDAESERVSSVPSNEGVTSRRRFLTAAVAGSATALAGCAELADGTDSLRVSVWSGHYADRFEESVVPRYEDEHDTDLEIQRGWDDILTDIRNAPEDEPPFDVTVAEGNFYYYGRQDDLFEPIREENVPNLDGVMEFYREMRETEYGVPVDGSPCAVLHREDADVEPESWSEFSSAARDSDGVGVDTGFWWYPLYAAAIGMDDAEGAEEMHNEELHDDVLAEFESWNVEGWASSGEDVWQDFENDVIDVAQWYYASVAYDIDDYDGITYTMPEETTGWFNNWCVVEGTNHRDEAEEFLNFLLDAEVQSEWSEHAPLAFSSEDIEYAEGLEEDLPTTTEEAESIAFPDWEYLAEHDDNLSDAVTDVQTSS
ncbi:ABC transporter substrate-binding protein [Natronococcus amylolyticus]|uniref:ABC transporter substrate-binding protein n=1 Tax=Natronococcus amylolyticus TaxID=44470 RepID=UPI000677B613|nr:PotD/PotF family extracellular solute-binding protein [Natronococcus amylolyticus]